MENEKELQLIPGADIAVVKQRKIPLNKLQDNEVVIYIVRNMLVEAGFSVVDEFMIASAASELTTNILRYAEKGTLDVSIIKDNSSGIGIELFAADSGPGINNLDEAMQDHLSTAKNSLGSGLPSVKRIMDEFAIESVPGRGTRVMARKWRQHGKG